MSMPGFHAAGMQLVASLVGWNSRRCLNVVDTASALGLPADRRVHISIARNLEPGITVDL
jgi:hypothetical protein